MILLRIIKDNDIDGIIPQKGWLIMFLCFLIFKGHIPQVINDESKTQDELYNSLRSFLDKFNEEYKINLNLKYSTGRGT